METQMSQVHQTTYNAIFQHPVARNLQWPDVRSMLNYSTELHGSVPERITPYDPDGSHRHLHKVDDESNGQRQPELKPFYEAIAQTLKGAKKILIFGSSTGASSAMDYLMGDLKERHPDIARRVIGNVIVNEQHMSEDPLLAQARAFYGATER